MDMTLDWLLGNKTGNTGLINDKNNSKNPDERRAYQGFFEVRCFKVRLQN
jgi:hypothetical protein